MYDDITPECFGKLWKERDPKCSGGLDPTYVHPLRRDRRRDRCPRYASCSVQTPENVPFASTMQPIHRPLPVLQQQLVRPPQAPAPAPVSMMPQAFQAAIQGVQQSAPPQYQQQQQQYQQPAPAPMVQYQQPAPVPATHGQAMVHPSMASVPIHVPVNHQAPGAQMPAYLTVPEPLQAGEGTLRPMMFTLLRSVIKAGCHSVANFYDHTPVSQWLAPPK